MRMSISREEARLAAITLLLILLAISIRSAVTGFFGEPGITDHIGNVGNVFGIASFFALASTDSNRLAFLKSVAVAVGILLIAESGLLNDFIPLLGTADIKDVPVGLLVAPIGAWFGLRLRGKEEQRG